MKPFTLHERRLMTLRFRDGLPLRDIAHALKMTETRAVQIEARSKAKLRWCKGRPEGNRKVSRLWYDGDLEGRGQLF